MHHALNYGMFIERTGQGTNLFLIHGWAMNRHCWNPLRAELPSHYRLNTIDLPGHGNSINCTVSLGQPQALIRALLDMAPDNAIWIGWSLGGLLAQMAAVRAPDQIRRLVSIGMGARFTATHNWSSATPLARVAQIKRNLAAHPSQTMHDFIEAQIDSCHSQEEVRTQLQRMIQPPFELEEIRNGLALLQTGDCRAEMSQYRGQVLYISGANDMICPPLSVKRSAALCRNGRFEIIAKTGHAPLLSHPFRISQLLESLRIKDEPIK